MTTTDPMIQEGDPGQPPPPPRPKSRVRLVVILVVVLAVIVPGVIYVNHEAGEYYTISPGTAPVVSAEATCPTSGPNTLTLPDGKPCVRLVVPTGKASAINGSIMMVDVLVGPTTFGEYALSKVGLLHTIDDGATLEPASSILGTTPANQLNCQDDQDMTDAQSYAAVVALRRLGYAVTENDLGAEIDLVQPGTAAAKAGLECNDLITSFNGKPIHTDVDLVNAIRTLSPGDTASIKVSRVGTGGHTGTLTLEAHLGGTPALDGAPALPKQAFLGVATETRTTFTFPYSVTIDVGDIGGPSAGLALTLGLLNALSGGNLTGGHRIAATGTIDLQGDVGAIGDAAQKAVAVRHAGAQVFFVPPDNYADAKSEAGSMKVIAVSSLQQALNDLKAMGGTIPATNGG